MTVLFEDGFDSGDFSAWTGVTGSPSVQSSVKHCGNYGMQTSGSGDVTVDKVCAASANCYLRFYVYFSNLPSSGNHVALAEILNDQIGDTIQVGVKNDGGTMKWGCTYPDNTYSNSPNPTTGVWYCIEIVSLLGVGREIFVNGVSVWSGSANYNNCNKVYVGAWDKAESLTVYLDSAKVADVYMGPESQDLTVTGNLTVDGNATVGGQLQLPATGSSGGIVLGGDTNLYRSSENTLRTDYRFHIVCPVSAVVPEYIKNQGWLWHYTSGIWDPSGMPIETTTNYLALQHPTLLDPNNNNQPYYADWTLAMIDTGRQDYPYWPILYTHSGIMIQRDLSAGGFIASNQGALALGHGLLKQMDPPKIWLVDSATSYIDGIVYQPDAPENPKDAQLFICNTDQNPYYELFHLYEWSGGQWHDQGDISAFQSQYFDTLHITKSDGTTPGHLDLGNLTAHGDVWTAAIHSVNGTYVQIADTLYIAGGVFPNSFDDQDCGSASYHWNYVRGNHLCYDIDHYLFDGLDDLTIVKNYKTKSIERKLKSGETVSIDVIDRDSMSHLLDEDGLYAQEKVGGFLLGCIKALVLRLEALENELNQKGVTLD